jgi:hypothetical protein
LGEESFCASKNHIHYPETELLRDGEPVKSKDVFCPARERLHRGRLSERTGIGAIVPFLNGTESRQKGSILWGTSQLTGMCPFCFPHQRKGPAEVIDHGFVYDSTFAGMGML